METSSQPPQPQGTQTKEALDLEIIDLPESSEDSSIRHAWLWHILLRVQRAVNLRAFRLIQAGFTLLLALIATFLLLSSSFIASGGTDGLVKLWFIARSTLREHAVHESL